MPNDKAPAVWSDSNKAVLASVVLEESRRLGSSGVGFKKASWTRIVNYTNRKIVDSNAVDQHSHNYDRAQMQSLVQQLIKKYTIYHAMRGCSGLGWDEGTGAPSDDVWQKYVKAHPGAKEFRNKGLSMYDQLHEIFSGSVATGRYAEGSNEPLVQRTPGAYGSDTSSVVHGASSGASSDEESAQRASCDSPAAKPGSASKRPESAKKRPPSSGDRTSGALEKLAENHERRVKQKEAKRAQLQLAVAGFVEQYGATMAADDKLKCLDPFMANSGAVQVYSILDDDTTYIARIITD